MSKIYGFLMLFCVFFVSDVFSTKEYLRSDLCISDRKATEVMFFHETEELGLKDESVTSCTLTQGKERYFKARYNSAIIYGSKSKIGNLSLEEYKNGFYYLCTEEESKYPELTSFLDEAYERFKEFQDAKTETKQEKLKQCTETSLKELRKAIEGAKTVVFTFGAGISYGYVPTLQQCFEEWGLEKVFSDDCATEESLGNFIQKITSEKKEGIFEKVASVWKKVVDCEVLQTPAHEALKGIIDFLQEKDKKVFTYTDNIDGIHHRIGIELSEENVEDSQKVIYPFVGNEAVIVAIGQAFDFHGILSTVSSRTKESKEITSFFSINPNSDSILIYEGLDVDKVRGEKDFDIDKYVLKSLDMKWVKGSAHEVLLDLLKGLKGE